MPQTHRTVREISCEKDIPLRCYEITTMSLVQWILNIEVSRGSAATYFRCGR